MIFTFASPPTWVGTLCFQAKHIYIVEPPFGLRLLLPFWFRRGGVLVHGWCAEKENRGKGGSGKGKIGAGVGSCRSMDPVRISSGSRDPVGHQFLHFWAPLLASRDPVGIQSGTNVGRQPNSLKIAFLECFARFWVILAAS